MKKPLFIFIGLLAIATTAVIIRKQTAPKFYIESSDKISKTGVFSFGGNKNTFSLDKGGSATARDGYSLTYGTKDGKTVYFDLYKNGKFIGNLATHF